MPAALAIRLSPSERHALLRQRRKVRSPRASDRITALLMLAAGVLIAEILDALGISRRTLLYWKQRWMKRRHFGFEDAERSGRPSEATATYVREMVRAVRRDPRSLGYAFTRWTAPRLSQYLSEVTGVRLTPKWLSELLRMHGFVWRKTKRTIRNLQNPAATKRAQKALKRLKKGFSRRERTTNSGSPTGSVSNSCRSRRTPTASEDVLCASQHQARTLVSPFVER